MLDGQLEDQTSSTTVYEGSALCSICGMVLTPVEVAYNGNLCTPDKRLAQRKLLLSKRVVA